MFRSMRKLTAVAAALALCTVSTAAMAASTPRVGAASVSPWTTLGAMSGVNTANASSLAAAQDYEGEGMGFPPIAPLIVILGTLALGIYIITKDDDDGLDFTPVSPN